MPKTKVKADPKPKAEFFLTVKVHLFVSNHIFFTQSLDIENHTLGFLMF